MCVDFSNRLDSQALKSLAESDEHESVREIKVGNLKTHVFACRAGVNCKLYCTDVRYQNVIVI